MKPILFTMLLVFSTASVANNKVYEYCIVWGVAGGSGDGFIQSLSGILLEKKGIHYSDKVCSDLKKSGYRNGQIFSTGNSSDEDARESWMIFQNFRDKVMSQLIDTLNL